MVDYVFRQAGTADAEKLLAFGNRLLAESDHFLRCPDERAGDVDQMAAIIRSFTTQPNHRMLNVWFGEEPVGEAVLIGGNLRRIRHCATVGVGVLQAHHRRGLGRRLMELVEEEARLLGLHRLELTVFHTNNAACRLYEQLGYKREGVTRESVLIGDRYLDQILMAKILP